MPLRLAPFAMYAAEVIARFAMTCQGMNKETSEHILQLNATWRPTKFKCLY